MRLRPDGTLPGPRPPGTCTRARTLQESAPCSYPTCSYCITSLFAIAFTIQWQSAMTFFTYIRRKYLDLFNRRSMIAVLLFRQLIIVDQRCVIAVLPVKREAPGIVTLGPRREVMHLTHFPSLPAVPYTERFSDAVFPWGPWPWPFHQPWPSQSCP